MKKILILFAVAALFVQAQAQEKWSLEKCIAYALENNIVIKQYQLNTEYQENELSQAKYNRLPSLSASVSQNVRFGRSETLDGTYDNFTQATTSAGIGANVLIWKGGVLNKTIRQNDYSFKSSIENLKKAKDDVTLSIASAYMEILFAKELLKVAETQVEQTQKQIERTKTLVDAGKVASGALLEIESQLAREELDLVNRSNNLQIAYLNLAQFLELDDYSNFEIEVPEIPELKAQMSLSASSNVYNKAVDIRPEIKSIEFDLEKAKVQLEVAESGKMPTLSASAGISDYFSASEFAPSFNDQVSKQLGEYIGLELSIPVFSKFQNRTNIENSKLQISNNELELESAKKTLRKQIEQAYINSVAALKRYNSNMIAVKSMQESFRYIEEKYNVGRVNSVEYNDAKTNLANAESNLIQAKYDFIFRSKILDFYNGIPIEL